MDGRTRLDDTTLHPHRQLKNTAGAISRRVCPQTPAEWHTSALATASLLPAASATRSDGSGCALGDADAERRGEPVERSLGVLDGEADGTRVFLHRASRGAFADDVDRTSFSSTADSVTLCSAMTAGRDHLNDGGGGLAGAQHGSLGASLSSPQTPSCGQLGRRSAVRRPRGRVAHDLTLLDCRRKSSVERGAQTVRDVRLETLRTVPQNDGPTTTADRRVSS